MMSLILTKTLILCFIFYFLRDILSLVLRSIQLEHLFDLILSQKPSLGTRVHKKLSYICFK